MIQQLKLYEGQSFDPHYNLAVEEYLLQTVEPDCCILYLWQNQNTVVIGRNQNAWKECCTTLLEEEGGHLARRLSGGGAVFHDLGNLNFTFLVPTDCYDLEKQLSVIQLACRSFGIESERSGRNDILAGGRKFSGNAFYRSGDRSYHHGTLLVDVDMARMSRYLNPSKAKLEAKGVDSVRSRVVNLKELASEMTTDRLKEEMANAFQQVYGLPCSQIMPQELDSATLEAIYRRNCSWEWNYGKQLPFTFSCQGQFPWGGIQLQLLVEGGLVQKIQVYSDAMDWEIAPALERALHGCRFALTELCQAVRKSCPEQAEALCHMLAEQGI